jgi:hypothetical protein
MIDSRAIPLHHSCTHMYSQWLGTHPVAAMSLMKGYSSGRPLLFRILLFKSYKRIPYFHEGKFVARVTDFMIMFYNFCSGKISKPKHQNHLCHLLILI